MKRILPPTYFLAACLLTVLLHFILPIHRVIELPWRLAGTVPLFIGILLNLLADRSLKLHKTTVKPDEESTTLITAGVFTVSRNPMYLGMVLILIGVAVLLGSVGPFLPALILAVLLDRAFIVPEERMLEATFGDRFRNYRDRTRRWL